jgi:hypothetical protein
MSPSSLAHRATPYVVDPPREEPKTPRPRRRWLKIGIVLVLLLGALLVFAPRLAATIARPRIEAALERSLDVEASLEGFHLDWSGEVRADGLSLLDRAGEPFLRAASFSSHIALLEALRGSYRVEGSVRGVELDLRRDEQGHWNTERILRTSEGGGAPGKKAPSKSGEELPDLALELSLVECLVRVTDARAGTYTIGPLATSIALPSIEAPASFELATPFRTPAGDEGTLQVEGAIACVRERRLDLEALDGNAKVELRGLPLDVARELGLLPAAIEKLTGSAEGNLRCTIDPARTEPPIAIEGAFEVSDLDLALAPSDPAEAPFALQEEKVGLELDLGLDASSLSADVRRIHLASSALSGDVHGKLEHLDSLAASAGALAPPARAVGVEARFTYVPDRIGTLLARWIPGELSGKEPQPITLTVDGPLARGDLPTMLEALDVKADLRVASFETAGVQTQGDLALTSRAGRAGLTCRFALNGGTVDVNGDLGLAASASGASTLAVKVDGAQARGELTPLLAWLHPVFASLPASKTGALEGTIAADLALAWPGPLPLAELELGGDAIDWKQLTGQGSFALAKAGVSGSAFLDQLLKLLGKSGPTQLSLQRLAFHVGGGRLAYDKPWNWSFGGLKTTFGGSIGFDRSLDLAWSVPLGEAFLKKQGLPKELAGKTLTLPLGGTLDHPKLDWKGAVDELAKDAWKKEFTDRIDDVKDDLEEKLGDELGKKVEDVLGGKGKDDPAELLERADALWAAGKKDEARPLYARIREEFELSATYLLNRDRIKERAKE